jgi:hypothetical protein
VAGYEVLSVGFEACRFGLQSFTERGARGLPAFEGSDDELMGVRRQIGDIADGVRARPVGRAKGLADEVKDAGFAAFTGRPYGLNERGLQNK